MIFKHPVRACLTGLFASLCSQAGMAQSYGPSGFEQDYSRSYAAPSRDRFRPEQDEPYRAPQAASRDRAYGDSYRGNNNDYLGRELERPRWRPRDAEPYPGHQPWYDKERFRGDAEPNQAPNTFSSSPWQKGRGDRPPPRFRDSRENQPNGPGSYTNPDARPWGRSEFRERRREAPVSRHTNRSETRYDAGPELSLPPYPQTYPQSYRSGNDWGYPGQGAEQWMPGLMQNWSNMANWPLNFSFQ